MMDSILELTWTVHPISAYGPDLASSDFHFTELKKICVWNVVSCLLIRKLSHTVTINISSRNINKTSSRLVKTTATHFVVITTKNNVSYHNYIEYCNSILYTSQMTLVVTLMKYS